MADETNQETIDERYIVPGLARGLQMLQSFTRDRQEQTVGEMAKRVGVSRSSAFRIVYTLEACGFLRRIEDSRRYQLGSRVLELGYSFLAGKDLIEVATPILRKADQCAHAVRLYEDYSFETYTPDTPDSMGALISLVENDRREACVVSWGFYDSNVASIAAPIFNATGKLEAAVSVSCPINTYDQATFSTQVRATVLAAAAEISRGLGYRTAKAA